MKKKIISGIAILLVSAITAGVILLSNPIVKYNVKDYGTPVVMTINGDEIHANEYAAYFLASKTSMESTYASFGLPTDSLFKDEQTLKTLQEQTTKMLEQYHIIVQQFKAKGLKLDKADMDKIKDYKEGLIAQYGSEEKLQQVLAEQGLTEDIFDNSLVVSACLERLDQYYFGTFGVNTAPESEILKKFNQEYVQAKHVLISTSDPTTGTPLTGAKLDEKKKLAEEVLKKAQNGEDFDALIQKYGEDPGMASSPKGYIFKDGEMVPEFYQATAALKDNEISALVKTDYGYHIIKRVPLKESSLDNMNTTQTGTFRSTISKEITGKDITTLLDELVKKVNVKSVDDEIKKITVDNAKEIAMTGSKTPAAATTAKDGSVQAATGSSTPSAENSDAGAAASDKKAS